MAQKYMVSALIGICMILMFFLFITDSLSEKRKKILFAMVSASMMLILSEQLAHFYDGNVSIAGIIIARTAKFLNYILSLSIIYVFSLYFRDILEANGAKKIPISLKINDYILLLGTIIVILSQFTGIYYVYDANNVYQRSSYYPISYVFSSVAIFTIAINIIKFRKLFSKRLFLPFFLFTVAPIVASIIHLFTHGFSFISATVVAMIVLLYCFSILDANEVMRNAHQKAVENTKLMVSQTVEALAEAIDAKDSYTNGHSRRVAEYSAKIAKKAGKNQEYCEEIYLVGLLHDVGKIGIPKSIINKPGKLTDEEFEIIKTHTTKGKEILSKIPISPNLAIGANYHHERYDGKGYPEGLKGEEIPEIARIIAVADTYDAMTSKRSYRDGLPESTVRHELSSGKNSQFDAKFVDIMLELMDEIPHTTKAT